MSAHNTAYESQRAATADPFANYQIVATSAGATIPDGARFVTIDSASAAYIVKLPAPVAGLLIRGVVDSTGCEIGTEGKSITLSNVVSTTAAGVVSKTAALAASLIFEALATDSTHWLLWSIGNTDGARTFLTPD